MKQNDINKELTPSESNPQFSTKTEDIPPKNTKIPMIISVIIFIFMLFMSIELLVYLSATWQNLQRTKLLNKQLVSTITLTPTNTPFASASGALQEIMLLNFNKEGLIIPKFSFNIPDNIVQETYTALKNSGNFANNPYIKLVSPASGKMWWITEDDFNILVSSSHIYYWIQGNDVYRVDHKNIPVVKGIVEVLKNILISNGFKINTKNSSDYQSDKKVFYDYITAYENGSTKCIVLVNYDTGGYPSDLNQKNTGFDINFNCTNQVQSAYQEQLPFLQALMNAGGSGALKYWANNIIVTNIDIKENSAYADIYGRRAGAHALFVRQDSGWKKIYDGQNVPDCKTLQDNNFSKQFSLNCVDYPNNEEIDYSTGKLYLKFGK